jgi:hypothetical protein
MVRDDEKEEKLASMRLLLMEEEQTDKKHDIRGVTIKRNIFFCVLSVLWL